MEIQELLKNIEITDDLIDNLLEPIKDYTDTLGDLSSPIKGLLSIYNLRKKILFKSFIKGYSQKIVSDKINEKDKSKMKDFLSKPENLIYVSEIMENAMNSISIKSSSILGLYAGTVLSENKPLDDIDYVLITAIKDLTDSDFENFNLLYDYLNNDKYNFEKRETSDKNYEYRILGIFNQLEELNATFSKNKIEFVVEKLKTKGILSYTSGGI